jgi:DNA-binding SARP family transcriptional activator
MPRLAIQLFGPPQLMLDGHPVSIGRRKSRALLYYLAAQPTPVTRDHVLTRFWPDHDRAAAQNMLRTNLHGLRTALGAALQGGDETLTIAPDVSVDVRQFAIGLASPSNDPALLSRLLEMYRGDFLAGFTLPDMPSFDDWIAVERGQYQRLLIRGLTALSHLHERHQHLGAALAALDRALAVDPLQEDLQRAAIRLSYLAGDRAGAIRRYDQLRHLLDDELGVPPMDETRALYDAIITDTLPRDHISPSVVDERLAPVTRATTTRPVQPAVPTRGGLLPFTGRTDELSMLHTLFIEPRLVVIEGEPGIGKTRLLEEFTRTTDTRILRGAAHEFERVLPYQPIIEALRDLTLHADWETLRATLTLPTIWLTEIARLLPELVEGTDHPLVPPPPADEARLWEGVHHFLSALARHQPLVLLLDDLHWADESTLALLGYMVRRSMTTRVPICYLAATRAVAPQTPHGRLLQTLTREDRVVQIALERLDADAVNDLAHQLHPSAAHSVADWLMTASEGNPYMLAELLREARVRGLFDATGNLFSPALAEPLIPKTVYALIQSRLVRLSEPARHILDAAVVVGRIFAFDVVAQASALSESAALDAIDELLAAGLVAPYEGGQFAFDHSLTMEVAEREVGELRHRRLHRRVGEALEQMYRERLDEVAGLLAQHFTDGGLPEHAAPYALRAGRQAAQLAAWREAIAFYEQALKHVDETLRCDVLMGMGHARYAAGDAAEAAVIYEEAAILAKTQDNLALADDARLLQGRTLLPQARYAEAVEIAQAVRAADRDASQARAELLWGTSLALEGLDLAAAVEHLGHAEALLARAAAPDLDSRALTSFTLGVVAAQQGDLTRAVAYFREVRAITEGLPFDTADQWAVLAQNNLAYHLHLMGDPSARAHAETGFELARERGILGFQTYLHSTAGEIALAEGDLDTAEQHFTAGLELAEQRNQSERIAGLSANLGRVAAQRGDTLHAIDSFMSAREQAEAAAAHHLVAQIRLWLAPLLPASEARQELAAVRTFAEQTGRSTLLDEVAQVEARLTLD